LNFSVWAPSAEAVDWVPAQGDGAPRPMRREEGGWWRADIEADAARGGYRYAIDAREAFPDPRSRWQPGGVHGASYAIEADAATVARNLSGFSPKPMRDAVIYELHIGTFTPEGTYAGAERRLRYLADLGVTHVELMPIATFPGQRGWGYDGVALYAPLPAYGTPADLVRFIDACHAKGLAVLLDVVYNHLGPDGNYLGGYGPYFTDRVKTPWGEAINYDGAGSDEVRRFVIDNALMWLRDYGFDGLRLDAVHAIYSFGASHILEELADAVRALGEDQHRSFVLIAESDLNDPRLVQSVARGGYGLDAHWCDDFHHAIHRYFTGENAGYYADFHGLEDVATAWRDGYVYQGQYSAFRQRRHGRPPAGVGADQLVVCAQNHDQIGNRARGERLSTLLDLPKLKAVAALTLLSPFVPMLFQGEEWGAATPFLYFTDHQDPALAAAVTAGRTREFASFRWAGEVPDPQAPATFERSKLDWSELSRSPHEELLDWHRRLIALRASRSMHAGRARPKVRFDQKAQWLRVEHAGLLAAFNFGAAPRRVPLPAGAWELVLRSDPEGVSSQRAAAVAGAGEAARTADAAEIVEAHGIRVYRRRGSP
jgi:maltooligosyltrehalose trehalohydrolase